MQGAIAESKGQKFMIPADYLNFGFLFFSFGLGIWFVIGCERLK